MPGTYKATLSLVAKGETRELAGAVPFVCKPLGIASFPANDLNSKYGWIKEMSEFSRNMYGTISFAGELQKKVNTVRQAIHQTPGATSDIIREGERINTELENIIFLIEGPQAKASQEEVPPMEMPLAQRLSEMAYASYGTSGDISTIAKEQLDILKVDFPPILERIKKVNLDLQQLDKQLDAIKAPWTPGRIPVL